jgi:hypothetical protein
MTSLNVAAWKERLAPRERQLQRLAIGVAAIVFVVQWIRAVAKLDDGDFFLHWKFATRFVHHEWLYADGLHIPYPPFWAMAWSPIAAVSLAAAKTLVYPLSLAALAALLYVLDKLTSRWLPLHGSRLFWATTLALALISRFLVRELPECGPNLLLLALSWLAVYLWTRRQDWLAGGCLGLATAMKCTPALFIAYFAWKRQWKLAVTSTVAAGLFTLAPALWQGPTDYSRHLQFWLANVRASAGQNDPSRGVLGEEELKNLSLRPAAARFLMRLPANHISRVDHPAYLEFLDFSPPTADRIIKLLLLALVAAAAWAFRGPVADRGGLTIVWECAGVSTLILLLSPITWSQHCVALLPAFYLVSRSALVRGKPPEWMIHVLTVYVVVNLLLNRGLIGRDWTMLLGSYHLPTLTFLGVLAVVIGCARRESQVTPAAAIGLGQSSEPCVESRNKAA